MWSKEVAEKLKIAVFPIKEKGEKGYSFFVFLTLKTLKSNSGVESRCAQKLISKLLAELNWALIEQLNTGFRSGTPHKHKLQRNKLNMIH